MPARSTPPLLTAENLMSRAITTAQPLQVQAQQPGPGAVSLVSQDALDRAADCLLTARQSMDVPNRSEADAVQLVRTAAGIIRAALDQA